MSKRIHAQTSEFKNEAIDVLVYAARHDGTGPPFIHKIYESGHYGDMSFLIAAKNDVRAHHGIFGNIPSIEGVEENEVRKITGYVRTPQRTNGIN